MTKIEMDEIIESDGTIKKQGIKIPKAEMVKVAALKTDKQNPNVMTKSQKEALAKNIKKYGFIIPIITNKEYVIADGQQRFEVARDLLKIPEVPVIRIPLKDIDRRILRQVLNKLKGEHEKDLDIAEFARIIEAGEQETLKELLALSNKEMSQILDALKDIEEVDTPPLPLEAKTKLGDIYQLGDHKLMCGDSTNGLHMDSLLKNDKVDMIFTDPPYGVSYAELIKGFSGKQWKDIKGDDMRGNELKDFLRLTLETVKPYMVNRWSCYMCFGARSTFCLFEILDDMKIKYTVPLVWSKGKMTISWNRYHPDYEMIAFFGPGSSQTGKMSVWYGPNNERTTWDIKIDNPSSYVHPTQKPVALSARAIRNSTKKADIVLDLFGGSGSTLIACEQMGRKARVMELEPKYCDVIARRWEEYTGKKATKIHDGNSNKLHAVRETDGVPQKQGKVSPV